MSDRVHRVENAFTHLFLLFPEETGYPKLCYLVSEAFEGGF